MGQEEQASGLTATREELHNFNELLQQGECASQDAEDPWTMAARQIAISECTSLSHCAPEERGAERKKILLKWHPDNQKTKEQKELAKLVMQEIQNRGHGPGVYSL